MTTTTITTIVNDIKQVAHQGIAAGVGALGAGLTADALQIADDITSGNLDGLEHLGVGLAAAVGFAAWAAARKVLARLFGGSPSG